jgi:hypothetical protein
MRCRQLVVVLFVFLCHKPHVAQANPFEFVGASTRSQSLASSGSASNSDGFAVFSNPSALTLDDNGMLSFGYLFMFPRFDAQIVNYGSLGNLQPYQSFSGSQLDEGATKANLEQAFSKAKDTGSLKALTLFAKVPFKRLLKRLDREVTIGLLVFFPGSGSTVVNVEGMTPNQPTFVWSGSRLQRLMVVSSLGIEVWRKVISVGAGVVVLSDIGGSTYSGTPISVFDPNNKENPPPPKPSTASFSQRLSTDVAPIVSILITPLKWLGFAISYRGQTDLALDFDGKAQVSFNLGSLPIEAEIPYKLHANFLYVPKELLFALSFKPLKNLQVFVDTSLLFTASYSSHLPVTTFSLDKQAIGENGELVSLRKLGYFRATEEGGVPARTRNVLVPRVGIEYAPIKYLCLRLGYAYEPSPLEPDQRYANMLLDSGFHRLGAGVQFDINDPLKVFSRPFYLSASITGLIFNKRNNRVGRVDEKGEYVARGVVRTGGFAVGGGVEAGFRF